MDEQLAGIANDLNREDPAIVAPQPPPERLDEGDVERRVSVVARIRGLEVSNGAFWLLFGVQFWL